jgi:hypothetical protein
MVSSFLVVGPMGGSSYALACTDPGDRRMAAFLVTAAGPSPAGVGAAPRSGVGHAVHHGGRSQGLDVLAFGGACVLRVRCGELPGFCLGVGGPGREQEDGHQGAGRGYEAASGEAVQEGQDRGVLQPGSERGEPGVAGLLGGGDGAADRSCAARILDCTADLGYRQQT